MWGPKYVWILMSGSYRQRWWTVNDTKLCTPDEVRKGLGHFIGTKALMYGADNEVTIARKVVYTLLLYCSCLFQCSYTAVAIGYGVSSYVLKIPTCTRLQQPSLASGLPAWLSLFKSPAELFIHTDRRRGERRYPGTSKPIASGR